MKTYQFSWKARNPMDSEMLLSEEFINGHPQHAARILEGLQIEENTPFLEKLPWSMVARVIRFFDPFTAAKCLENMAPDSSSRAICDLPSEIASVFLRMMDDQKRDAIFEALPNELRARLKLLLRYPEGTAGALMCTSIFVVPDDITVGETLKRLRTYRGELSSYIFAVNRQQILAGYIDPHELLRAAPGEEVVSIMRPVQWRLSPRSKRQAVLNHPGWRELSSLPVVDEKGILLGCMDYRTFRRLELEEKEEGPATPVQDTGRALGELYWIGASALIKGFASTMGRKSGSPRID
jgi:magnesium transporter